LEKLLTDCIFCKIANKELPATLAYEDESVIAFDDLYPRAPIHKLIIPRKHIATLNDLEPSDTAVAGRLMYTAQQLAKQYGIAEEGYRVVMNCNAGAGQAVFHIHLHLLGGRQMTWPPG
jgi:histidine triad (HIT) family protein